MTPEQKKTYRQHVKQNIEKCIELVGSIKELSNITGFAISTIKQWRNGSRLYVCCGQEILKVSVKD